MRDIQLIVVQSCQFEEQFAEFTIFKINLFEVQTSDVTVSFYVHSYQSNALPG